MPRRLAPRHRTTARRPPPSALLIGIIAALVLSGSIARPASATQWSILDPRQGPVIFGEDSGATELSGLTWAGGDQYYAVSDKLGRLYPLTITLNLDGTIANAILGPVVNLTDGKDVEGVIYDAASGDVVISDENGPAIREHSHATGELIENIELPPVFSHIRSNLSLESLAFDTQTRALWTANEEALSVDGPISSFVSGTTVRLQRFSTLHEPNGQWAYVTEPLAGDLGNPGRDVESCGVSELIAVPGGDLLVLERSSGAQFFLQSRLFQVSFAGATDTSDIAALDNAAYTAVSKTQLWSHSEIAYNFEGAALGPTLPGGARSLILISDSGGGLLQALYALVLRPAVCGNGVVELPETCDDSNTASGDGCTAQCRLETCGDGVLNNRGNESCDDGNHADGDGCASDCKLEVTARRCQETIIKAARSYAFDRMKALRRCRDQLNRGRTMFLDTAQTQSLSDPADCAQESDTKATIAKAGLHLRNEIASEFRPRCSDAYVALFGACAKTVDGLISAAGDSGCLLAGHDAAVDQMLDDEYGRRLQPTETDLRRCQDTISKAAGRYAEARWQALNTCRIQLSKGRTLFRDQARQMQLTDPAQCSTEFKTTRKIARAADKVRQAIASPVRQACSDDMLANLATACATTIDGLVGVAGGGCLITGHDAAIDAAAHY